MAIKKSEKQLLLEKIENLLIRQDIFRKEINDLRFEIRDLKLPDAESIAPPPSKTEVVTPPQKAIDHKEIKKEDPIEAIKDVEEINLKKQKSPYAINTEIEKFIGENLINKIGIAVLVIGVSIGTKYAIDHDLISPLMRIVLGYLVGFGLAGFAVRLKNNYKKFSAVLISGAMAIFYFITYAAYSYYNLYPLLLTVILMILITILTVALALYYNQQVIAHFGLVGAYVVPYLLREPFAQVPFFFSYIAMINVGILFISAKKKWKFLYYLSFLVTWVIFISWFFSNNYTTNNLDLCLSFLSIFFIVFYLSFLSYKLVLNEKFKIDDIVILLSNSAIMFGIGYVAINAIESGKEFLGLFTLLNAVVHSIVGYIIYRVKPKELNLIYFVSGLALVFITIAIPVQFNDNVVTILWAIEAAIIFWYGRRKEIPVYEKISYAIIFLVFFSIAGDWASVSMDLSVFPPKEIFTAILNMGFLTSLVAIASMAFIWYTSKRIKVEVERQDVLGTLFNLFIPAFLLTSIYFLFYFEISIIWHKIYIQSPHDLNSEVIISEIYIQNNPDILRLKYLWLINYTILFASLLSFANYKWLKAKKLNVAILLVNFAIVLLFLGGGLYLLNELRDSYLSPQSSSQFKLSFFYLMIIRYVSVGFFALLFYSLYSYVIRDNFGTDIKNTFEVILSLSIVWVCSSELINWMDLSGSIQPYKLGLSILWGILSLLLIVYGIWKKKKYIRITAIALFGITLVKLFFYDIAHLETIPKTIVFILLGSLLLVISFLYNKYKHFIFEESKN